MMPSARDALLSSEPLEDMEACQVSDQSSSRRSGRIVLGVSFTAFFTVAVFLAYNFPHAGFLSSSQRHAAHLQFAASVGVHLPPHLWFLVAVLVLVIAITLGHIILGRLLKFLIIQGTKRVLVGTNITIGQLRFAPCGGRLYMNNAGVSQPQGFVTDQKASMIEVSTLIFDMSMCALWCSLIKNKLDKSALVIGIDQFTLKDMIIRFEQKLSRESNLKKLVDQIQDLQKKYGGDSSKKKTKAESVKHKLILHRVDVTGLQLQVRGAGVNMPPVKLPDIQYVDFVSETKATGDVDIALEIAGRILKLAMVEGARQIKSTATSVTDAIKQSASVKAISEHAEKQAKALAETADKVTEAFAKTKVGSKLEEAGRDMKEKASKMSSEAKGAMQERALKIGEEAKQKTAKISEASKQITAGAMGFMDQVVQKAEASLKDAQRPGSSSKKDGTPAPSSDSAVFPTPVRTGAGTSTSAAARLPPDLQTPLISSAAPKPAGRQPDVQGTSGKQPTAASTSTAPPPPGRPLDDSCNQTGVNFAAAAASIKDDFMTKVDSATNLLKGVTDRLNFCQGPSRTGVPDEEIRFN
mmetsp:Transcript_63762/g.116334  ORF Transcript_63762/g.116334 Transcript_63762/m.116334 type:complete len:581 (-) Transcript_63762:46-1788(-)